jgi:hypothetical protein
MVKGVKRSVALRAISRMVRTREMRLKPTLVASQLGCVSKRSKGWGV